MKPRDKVWAYFQCNSGTKKQQCSFCDWSITENASRMKEHLLLRCPHAPEQVKMLFTEDTKAQNKARATPKKGGTGATGMTPKKSSQESAAPTLTQEEKGHLDEEFARAVYATASPFMLSENRYFKKFIQTMKSEYTPPTRRQLSGILLIKEYRRIEQDVNEMITQATVLSIMCDGWTNVLNNGIINIIITTPKPVFITSIDTTTNPHSGEYLAKMLLTTMEKYGTEKFQALVTDNAAANKKAWAILERNMPNLQCYGCMAHSLNLILADFLECRNIKEVVQEGKTIVNGINPKQVLKAQLNQRSSITLKLPVKTRWLSMEEFLSSLLANKMALKEMAIQDKLSQALQSIILGSDFWERITELKTIICVVTTCILRFEGDGGDISECYPAFAEMLCELEKMDELSFFIEEKNYMMEVIRKRKIFAIRTIHKASYLINPKYLGKTLSASDRFEAINFMVSISTSVSEDQLLNDIADFTTKSGQYNVPIIWKYIETNRQSPLQWWIAFFPETPLCQIAQRILQAPPTSCACERSFSQQKNVHTAKRNRLGSNTVDKLMFVKMNLALTENKFQNASTSREEEESDSFEMLSDTETASDVEIDEENVLDDCIEFVGIDECDFSSSYQCSSNDIASSSSF